MIDKIKVILNNALYECALYNNVDSYKILEDAINEVLKMLEDYNDD